ncbi:hypothetical protein D9M70_481720 [compost metagenome]
MVEGGEQVIGGEVAGVAADRLPVGRVAPAFVERLQRILIGGGLLLERQRAGSLGHQAAVAGQLHVQALGQVAEGLVLARLGEVEAERPVHALLRQRLAVPGADRFHGARQRADHLGVADALVEQCGDRQEEHQHQEQHQRQHQGLRLQAVEPLGAGQALLEGQAGEFGDRDGGGHAGLR